MAHTGQERYSKLVLAKIRQELVLKDGVVFNNDYEGKPTAGAVKIPVRDTEVAVSDYDKANGITAGTGSTSYETMTIDKDKAVNEIIDGYDADSVPDNLVADRIDSAGYSLAKQMDSDGATVLLAGSSAIRYGKLTKENVYQMFVDARTAMGKANIPDDGKRYALVTPDVIGLVLSSAEFVKASDLGDKVIQTGAIGKIAGFLVIEFNDDTENLGAIFGHPRFATRAKEFSVPVAIVDLKGSGKYIGASAVQGREVYAHKVLRSVAIKAVYTNGCVTAAVAEGTNAGETKVTATIGTTGSTLAYKKNPAKPAYFGVVKTLYAGTSLTSGTAKAVTGCAAGDVIEVLEFDANGVCISKVAITLETADIKA